ncbi:MAG: hypothetical protein WA418_33060 [Bradyrhizobium sp.]
MGTQVCTRIDTASGGRPDAASIQTLEAMLDYAIIEGAEMRRPMFVYLLRLARLELLGGIDEIESAKRSASASRGS